MENVKLKKASLAGLIASILPLATFIPVFLKITLPDSVRNIWASANIVFVLVGICLSVICVCKCESRSVVNITSMIISTFWALLMAGIAILALFLNILH